MRKYTLSLMFLAVMGVSALAQAESGSTSARDDCISNLRGLADMNAAMHRSHVVKIDAGQYEVFPDGGAKCAAQFLIIKEDGTKDYSQIFSGQVAPSVTPQPHL